MTISAIEPGADEAAFLDYQRDILGRITSIYALSYDDLYGHKDTSMLQNETIEINETGATQADATPPETQETGKATTKRRRYSVEKPDTDFKPNRAMRRAFLKQVHHSSTAWSVRRMRKASAAMKACARCGCFYMVPAQWPAWLRNSARCQCKAEKRVHADVQQRSR